jgi:phospholipid/cholesterol/gamma-HCH transport system permease protein
MAAGWVKATRQGEAALLVLGGTWTLDGLRALDAQLAQTLRGAPAARVRFDAEAIERLDTAGAWLIARTERTLAARGAVVEPAELPAAWRELLGLARAVPDEPLPASPPVGIHALLIRLGAATVHAGHEALLLVSFLGQIVVAAGRTLVQPWRLRGAAVVRQIERTGVDALPIVGLLAFLIGIVLSFQGADQLRRFGAEIFAVNLLGISVLRELGVLLTAIIVAGRSGSSFTAQLGAMEVNEEIDALRTIGLDPIEVLVLPRVIGLVITLPLLTVFANLMALFGGCLMAVLALELPAAQVLRQLAGSVTTTTLWVGLIKAPVFAFLIAMVGCYEGLRVSRSADSVGRLTTTSVVLSIFLVILVDALFSILFVQLGV